MPVLHPSAPRTTDAETSMDAKKVKLVCHYSAAGGSRSPPESKLVSLPRSISFRELQSKLTGGPPQTPPTIKYQLPGDVCILSVSSDDDLALMLEEYDSLLARAPDGGPNSRLHVYVCQSPTSDQSGKYQGAVLKPGNLPVMTPPWRTAPDADWTPPSDEYTGSDQDLRLPDELFSSGGFEGDAEAAAPARQLSPRSVLLGCQQAACQYSKDLDGTPLSSPQGCPAPPPPAAALRGRAVGAAFGAPSGGYVDAQPGFGMASLDTLAQAVAANVLSTQSGAGAFPGSDMSCTWAASASNGLGSGALDALAQQWQEWSAEGVTFPYGYGNRAGPPQGAQQQLQQPLTPQQQAQVQQLLTQQQQEMQQQFPQPPQLPLPPHLQQPPPQFFAGVAFPPPPPLQQQAAAHPHPHPHPALAAALGSRKPPPPPLWPPHQTHGQGAALRAAAAPGPPSPPFPPSPEAPAFSPLSPASPAPAAAAFSTLQKIAPEDMELGERIGDGTYAVVHRAWWRGAEVAVKILRLRGEAVNPGSPEAARTAAAFAREAALLGRLQHPNVLALYGVVASPSGPPAAVLELMPHGSLKEALQRRAAAPGAPPLPLRTALLLALGAARALEYLHAQDPPVVHFDLKAENLLLDWRDESRPVCKLADLGLACSLPRPDGAALAGRGTLWWMAPELFPPAPGAALCGNAGSPRAAVGPRVDVYSFGVVMWEILTCGGEPYGSRSAAEVMALVRAGVRPPVPAACPADWASLMRACWAADPADRPGFSEVVARLARMLASSPEPHGGCAHTGCGRGSAGRPGGG